MKKLIQIYTILILITGLAMTDKTAAGEYDSKYFENHYGSLVKQIYQAAEADSSSWERLAYMCDTYGPRLSGSENLEKALDWIYNEMKKDGYDSVWREEVYVPHWVRGIENCQMLEPRIHDMPIKAIGGTIGTPSEGITAPVLVVDNFDELKAKADEAKGKIVVFCEGFQNYGQAVRYRFSGASMAAAVGAVAALIYPPSPHSMYNPHTGMMEYIDSLPKIPIASLSAEDALLLERLYKRGQKPVVHIYMEAETLPDAPSYNVIAEIKGSEKPDDIIVMGGHSDSWDVGSGAHDDGGGIISTWEALRLIKKIGLKPKRTIRAVMFVNEENGVRGGKAYAEKHKMEKHSLVFEFDSGVFPPDKMQFQGQDSIFNAIKPIEAAFKGADSLQITKGGWGVDIGYMVRMGVPGLSLNTKDDGKYFWYHHANTDTPDKVDPKDLSRCVAAIASMIFIYSDLPFNFDTNNEILPNNKTK